ncbi:hypothetical protein BVC80_1707g180 [Macleaya cordata]|uniref:F-box domain-containing protein n=1 Tax=Macleaya cordata TaxID=56857 RepID=A0A200Q6I7_MACCD|nr:hypothetical protein BVC80_1707g180 [Macleaya cordata]
MKSSSSTSSTATTVNEVGEITISTVHPDILLTHIFTRLDGPTLAAASCASSQLHTLSAHQSLWTNICHSTWPSTNHPRMRHLISTFPNGGPRSFFSDSFPLLVPNSDPPPPPHHQNSHLLQSSPPPELISAVDIHYKNNLIFSKVQETETLTGWFRCSPFRIDLLDPKDVVPTSIQFNKDTCQDLDENLKLSWIVVDSIGRRAANMSSVRPVSVRQHWLTGEIELKFVTILTGDNRGGSTEFVQSEIVVTCGGSEGGDMHVREVSMKMEDMDGMNLSGKDSLGILQRGMVNGKRKKGREEEGEERYEEYLKRKEEREERKLRREGRLDRICIAFGVSICSAFCMFAFFC